MKKILPAHFQVIGQEVQQVVAEMLKYILYRVQMELVNQKTEKLEQ